MVITDEFKFPRPVKKVDPYKRGKKVEAIDSAHPVLRIGAFKREWQRSREEQDARRDKEKITADEATVRRLVGRVNEHLDKQNILLHLVLTCDDAGYAIDVYDCTSRDRCTVIRDIIIAPDELPILLRNLEQESGILLDTVS